MLAELLAGRADKVRRFGRKAKLSGRRRRVSELAPLRDARLSLADAVKAGARLEPGLVYQALPLAIDPEWTRGHTFTVAQRIVELAPLTWHVAARDGLPLRVVERRTEARADADVTMSRAAFERMLRNEPPRPATARRSAATARPSPRSSAGRTSPAASEARERRCRLSREAVCTRAARPGCGAAKADGRASGAVGDRERAGLAAAQVVEQRGARGGRRRVDQRVQQSRVVGGEVVQVRRHAVGHGQHDPQLAQGRLGGGPQPARGGGGDDRQVERGVGGDRRAPVPAFAASVMLVTAAWSQTSSAGRFRTIASRPASSSVRRVANRSRTSSTESRTTSSPRRSECTSRPSRSRDASAPRTTSRGTPSRATTSPSSRAVPGGWKPPRTSSRSASAMSSAGPVLVSGSSVMSRSRKR